MEPNEFEKYLSERYKSEVDWYDKKSAFYKNWYRNFQFVLIILSSITPVLIGLNQKENTEFNLFFWSAIIISLLVAVITSLMKVFKFQENWINYRTTCETLKKEIYLYNAGIQEYGRTKDKPALFVERVESLISRENTLWLMTHREEKIDK